MRPVVIFDVDGVLLSERPYWDAALATALQGARLLGPVRGRLGRLGDLAFGEVGLQRVTKRHGCNSNWDLAAVLDRAMTRDEVRELVALGLEQGRDLDALRALERAAAAQWSASRAADDPLAGFGIRRDGPDFARVVEGFQDQLGTSGPPAVPAEATGGIVRVLSGLVERGFDLRICTGRGRRELEPPLAALGLDVFFDASALTCADETDRAERLTDRGHLGKPHWFGPAAAALGFDTALELLTGSDAPTVRESVVYVGDGWSDFRSIEACRERGLDMAYVHVRSGVCTEQQEQSIAATAFCLGVVHRLGELLERLPEGVT